MKLRQIIAPVLALSTLLPFEARAENQAEAPRAQIGENVNKVIECVRKKGFKFKGAGRIGYGLSVGSQSYSLDYETPSGKGKKRKPGSLRIIEKTRPRGAAEISDDMLQRLREHSPMLYDALTFGALSGEFTDGIGSKDPDGKVDLGYDWSAFFDKEDRPRSSARGALCSISDDVVQSDSTWKEAQKDCDSKFVNVDLGRRTIQRRYELVLEDIATSPECSSKKGK